MARRGFLGALIPALTKESPATLAPRRSASVAVVFVRTKTREEVLLIRRAEREGDPWSGQVAFPGGMVSASDASFEVTARRETLEEVGVDMSKERARFLGYMPQRIATLRDIVVVPSVFEMSAAAAVKPNTEVASATWVPTDVLAKKEARSKFFLESDRGRRSFPSLVYRDLVIWGLTERILSVIIDAGSED